MFADIVEKSLTKPLYETERPVLNILSIFAASVGIVVLFPYVLVLGYMAKVRHSILNDNDLPEFTNYGELWYIGKQNLIAYLPVFVLVLFIFTISLFFPFVLPLATLAFVITPIVAVKFSETFYYQDAIDREIIELSLNGTFMKMFIYYWVIMAFLLGLFLVLSIATFGVGFVVFLPVIMWFRSLFWAYTIKEIRD